MKQIKYLSLLFIVGLFSLVSCTKGWDDLNTDPNNPTDAPATNVLAHSIRYTAQRFFNDWQGMNNFLSYSGQVTKIQYTDEAHYDYRESTVNSAWRDYYITLTDLKKITQMASDGENDDKEVNMKATAITFSAFLWQMATDQWGDIPFSEALRGEEGITNPKYDSQQDIYMALLDTLKDAADLFDPVNGGDVGNGDILYNNDPVKWQKFCNSLRLKLAIRISYIDPTTAGNVISEIMGDPTKYPVFTSNDDAAVLTWTGVQPYQEPWYDNKYNRNRDDHGAAKTLVDTLVNTNDPRLDIYVNHFDYTGNDMGYVGQVEGAGTNTAVARPGEFFRDNPSGYTYFMRYAEVCFDLAEAYLRGLGVGADDAIAQSYYEDGINASMSEYSVDNTAVSTYMAQAFVDWNSPFHFSYTSANADLEGLRDANDKIVKIVMQKWLAEYKEGQELWAESRRNDFPQVQVSSLCPFTGHTRQGFRYPYPTDEQNLNGSNLSQVTTGIVDEFWGKQMWWDTRTGVQ